MLVPETYPAHPVLLVDDEECILQSYSNLLRNHGVNNILCCSESRHVLGLFGAREVEAVVLDLSMPHLSGQELLPKLVGMFADVPVIVVTADTELDMAVNCMKQGAFDYLVKPVEPRRFITTVERAIQVRELKRENADLKRHFHTNTLDQPEVFARILTNDAPVRSLFLYVESIAPSSEPVLILGETGTGKELFAQAIHASSARTGDFVPVNVAGLDDNMFADALFGHVKGAYTGANESRPGLIEKAAGGTLFLDEIGDLTVASQVKLLRFLQEKEYRALGADTPKHSDARVVVATNRDIRRLLEAGAFRQDLYYRLLAHQVRIPPLRERMNDLPLLVNHFLDEAARELRKTKPTPPKELLAHLGTYHFPGNVRELKAMVHNAVSRHQSGVLSLGSFIEHITDQTLGPAPTAAAPALSEPGAPLGFSPEKLPTLDEATFLLVEEALRRADNNQGAAAAILGVSRQTMNRYCQALRAKRAAPEA
jgi:DNA-binding NtrC family response regulator